MNITRQAMATLLSPEAMSLLRAFKEAGVSVRIIKVGISIWRRDAP